MTIITIYAVLFGLSAITRPLTVFVHELGHGIPALLLTEDKVQLYIGSYGDPDKGLNFSIGRLEIFFRYNPFFWHHGLCVSNADEVTIAENIIIVLLGPVASLIFGLSVLFFAFHGDIHGSLKILGVFIFVSSLFDFFLNIIPNERPIILHDGTAVYNDGQQLKRLFEYEKLPSHFESGAHFYNQNEFAKAAEKFHNVLDSGVKEEHIFRLAVSSYLQAKNYSTALFVNEDFAKIYELNSDDYSNSGFIKLSLGMYEESLSDFRKSLKKNPRNHYSFNNRGYAYLLMENFREAAVNFEKAIELQPDFAYPYNNRGLIKIKSGDEEGGLIDIYKSIELDADNSYAYRNLGIYYFDKGDFKNAETQFEKAYSIDPNTHLLQDYMEKLR